MTNRTKWLLIFGLVGLTGVALVLGAMLLQGDFMPPRHVPVAELAASATPAETATAAPTTSPTDRPAPAIGTAPTVAPSSPTPTASPLPTQTAVPYITYTVVSGDTVIGIALSYNVGPDDIVAANDLEDPDHIEVGQVLRVPVLPADVGVLAEAETQPAEEEEATAGVTPGTSAPAPTATVVAVVAGEAFARPSLTPDWPPSIISGDLADNYPLTQRTPSGQLLIHYQNNTYPADNVQILALTIDDIFTELQRRMRGQVSRPVDVYLGGTLFSVNPVLQGFTQSREFRTFVLVNGAFHPGERNYILGHELTHVAAINILGPASSTMIHEGLATYLPRRYLFEEADYLPIEEICAAAYQTRAFRSARELAQMAYGRNAFGGHIHTFFHYNLSGCFVGYLLENFSNGMERMNQVYDSGDYFGVYGRTLGELDQAWQASLEAVPLSVDAEAFVAVVEEVAAAYERYASLSAGGRHYNYEAYLHLNQARLAAHGGHLDEAHSQLAIYRSLMDG